MSESKMGAIGLLVLTQPVRKIIPNIAKTIQEASQHINKTLYVHLDTTSRPSWPECPRRRLAVVSHVVTSIYRVSSGVDVRVLLPGFKWGFVGGSNVSEALNSSNEPSKCSDNNSKLSNLTSNELPTTNSTVDTILIDSHSSLDVKEKYNLIGAKLICLQVDDKDTEEDVVAKLIEDGANTVANQVYESVVAGGTFDGIHAGHKILLSEALVRCSRKFTLGVAEGSLLKNKTLKELIIPVQDRIDRVREFMSDIEPSLEYSVVPITDAMGPTRYDPDMDMIVVSEETRKGIDMINKARSDLGLKILDGYIVPLVEDSERREGIEEQKVSSSSLRMRRLGSLLKPLKPNPNLPSKPHVIGLTGGSASGKSSIAKRLAKLGAGIIDCDKLGHLAYQKDTNCYHQLINKFGPEILSPDSSINRQALGSKVFSSKQALEALNGIVWPEIGRLAREETERLAEAGCEVVVLDAAVLLEAGWDQFCHQVWVSIINPDEAMRRIVERDNKTPDEAARRIANQISNSERVASANVVFCTQWEGDYTQLQVEKAWEGLVNGLRKGRL